VVRTTGKCDPTGAQTLEVRVKQHGESIMCGIKGTQSTEGSSRDEACRTLCYLDTTCYSGLCPFKLIPEYHKGAELLVHGDRNE
jgi:hypothetical protein